MRRGLRFPYGDHRGKSCGLTRLLGAGTLFGLAFIPRTGVYFVDDGTNTLNLLYMGY